MVIKGALLFLVVCAAARAASAGDGPLPNGNFEDSPDRFQMDGSRVTGANAIPQWKITGHVEYIESGQKEGDMILTVPEGSHAVRLGEDGSIHQQLSVAPGTQYSVTFSAARTCAQYEKLTVSVVPGDASDEISIQTVYTSSGWDSYCWAFQATNDVMTLTIHNPVHEDDPACGPMIDSVAIKALYPPQAAGDNLLRNGDFEQGPYIAPGSPFGVLVPNRDETHISPISGWMIMSYSKVIKYVDSQHYAVPHGSYAVELVSGGEAALVQEVDTAPGSACRLEFSVGNAGNRCESSDEQPMRVLVSTAGGSKTVVHRSDGNGGGTTRASLEFTAIHSRTKVVFSGSSYHTKSDSSGTRCGPVVDDASLVCVPPTPARRLLR
ncbi:unnamed protein product [Triticum aestivum]|uniref:DUF642 domain-containing protein n=5 Tax=Triticinae TaxID=1648030 RepID=A0A9R1EUP1_WHEAT|nr:uncharacterized protein LOC109772005 [Aegilops tauschii subsp. strangulata]XP_044328386.1 uncharacterized protein LOC123049552 [Triticum aestivum]KAF7017133.1 hypothetical protein CFC21_030615 [Triticum aestivum]SPT18892.1 unnamed protein product [Triticum aestivum]